MSENVFHYTTAGGLKGILESSCLHATHAYFLNDPNEIFFGKTIIRNLLRQVFRDLTDNSEVEIDKFTVDEEGNPLTDFDEVVDNFAHALVGDYLGFADPYLVSFCRHTEFKHRKEGILSQWRGYGGDGGYAIEFDTRVLNDLLNQEMVKYRYLYGEAILPVRYGDVDTLCSEFSKMPNMMDAIKNFILDRYQPNNPNLRNAGKSFIETIEKVIPILFYAKSEGFSEETESRIMFGPWKRGRDPLFSCQKEKELFFRTRDGAVIPYIKLFERPGELLPIRSIMVGPHHNQKRRIQGVRLLCEAFGYVDVKVLPSAIHIVGTF